MSNSKNNRNSAEASAVPAETKLYPYIVITKLDKLIYSQYSIKMKPRCKKYTDHEILVKVWFYFTMLA